jgi:hypothetical protein
MENIVTPATSKSPYVYFDQEKGVIELKGKSLIEDATEFFMPLVEWLLEYNKNPKDVTLVNFDFEYFNTSCSKWLITLTKLLNDLHNQGHVVNFNWYYEDDDVFEYGQVIQDLVEMPFNFVEKIV